MEQRLRDGKGRHGRLHAKLAIADGKRLLVFSANLTEFAVKVNLECGLLISGGTVAVDLRRHLRELASEGVLRSPE